MENEEGYRRYKVFTARKNVLLNAPMKPLKDDIEVLITEADALGCISSKAQLERYRDHYYKEEK